MKIISVVGARPNFMKIAPFIKAIEEHNASLQKSEVGGQKSESATKNQKPRTKEPIEHLLVHTGQHYDDRMNRAFFEALGIPDADINLGIGSGTHAEQVGNTMIAFEKVIDKEKPDWVIVVGDVNATAACSITAKKQHVKVAHIEAGLRSGDMDMPEEINRLVTDRLSDLLLTPDLLASQNLRDEGVSEEKIKFVGNIMIDTLEANKEKASGLEISDIIKTNALPNQQITDNCTLVTDNCSLITDNCSLITDNCTLITDNCSLVTDNCYAIMTLHRPSNVDTEEILRPIIEFLTNDVTQDMALIWPIHPRAKKQLESFGLWDKVFNSKRLILTHPLGYHELLRLNMNATLMLTDSGGLQEECCVLGTPCLTLRWNTERPITLREHGGASVLVGNNIKRIKKEYQNILTLKRDPQRPALWDGKTAMRCVKAIVDSKT